MKRYIYKLILLSMLFSTSSCDKWLTLEPQDGIIRQEYWKTKEDVEAAVIGCYSSMAAYLPEPLFIWGEIRGDMITPSVNFNSDEVEIVNVNIQSTNSRVSWSSLYKVINDCNTVIDFAPQVLKTDNTFRQEALDQYLAEALTIRSLMYFYLARLWGDVPLKLASTSSDVSIVSIPKSPQAEVLSQVVEDLKEAKRHAKVTYGDKASDVGRINRFTVHTILADVYLWMEQYDNTIAECDTVISSGRYKLVEGNSGWYDNLYYNGNSPEGIFELQFTQGGLSNPFYNLLILRKRFEISGKVVSDIFPVDPDAPTRRDRRGDGDSYSSSDNAVIKYSRDNPSYVHWFFYRYADVLLMRAEALNEANRGQEALDEIAKIRTRASALNSTNKTLAPDDKTGIEDFILEERGREFAFEGKRWFDLLRNAKRNNYERLSILLDAVSASVPADKQQAAMAKFMDVRSHYFPVYQGDLQADRNLTQNPFYQ